MAPQRYGDRWETIRPLGEGGQGFTYLVRDIKGGADTQYVLKRVKNPKRAERFRREVQTTRDLDHPGILKLLDFDLEAEKPYYVSEYCSGGSLADSKTPLWRDSSNRALEIFLQICEGLAYAHSHDVIHRDIKPENIYLLTDKGPTIIGDFGLSYANSPDPRFTSTAEAVGPRLFMAPELEDGRVENVTAACDVYSLGKVLYWLVSGGRMFSREKHRQPEWDLKGNNVGTVLGWNNIYFEHINRLLDLMIVADPSQRRSAANILVLARQAVRLVEREFTPIAQGIVQPCLYCGKGWYGVMAKTPRDVTNFGLGITGTPDWRILVCDTCGHVQFFRIEGARNKEWWDGI